MWLPVFVEIYVILLLLLDDEIWFNDVGVWTVSIYFNKSEFYLFLSFYDFSLSEYLIIYSLFTDNVPNEMKLLLFYYYFKRQIIWFII